MKNLNTKISLIQKALHQTLTKYNLMNQLSSRQVVAKKKVLNSGLTISTVNKSVKLNKIVNISWQLSALRNNIEDVLWHFVISIAENRTGKINSGGHVGFYQMISTWTFVVSVATTLYEHNAASGCFPFSWHCLYSASCYAYYI